ncbi:MAG TPA: orotidine-5'-phosphate decarboxylase [Blastocatellia bacterium]|nr:orotidine-5'-phosphate decarboxylase [Blastocatellia bacterium]
MNISRIDDRKIEDRLIVALDVADRAAALELVEKLNGLVAYFKIGSQLFAAEGPDLVREVSAGARVFLDLKFHDIPNTVAGAVTSACHLGVSLLNVHGLGGTEMMRAAHRAAAGTWRGNNSSPGVLEAGTGDAGTSTPKVIAVTVLTSTDEHGLAEIGVAPEVDAEVVRLAALARDASLDGVVASPREIRIIRERVAAKPFLIVTPGVRPQWAEVGDQKRISTPGEAISDGADYIVVGRPITASRDPKAAAAQILEEIAKAEGTSASGNR